MVSHNLHWEVAVPQRLGILAIWHDAEFSMRVAAICTSVTLALISTSKAVAEVEFGNVVAYKGILRTVWCDRLPSRHDRSGVHRG